MTSVALLAGSIWAVARYRLDRRERNLREVSSVRLDRELKVSLKPLPGVEKTEALDVEILLANPSSSSIHIFSCLLEVIGWAVEPRPDEDSFLSAAANVASDSVRGTAALGFHVEGPTLVAVERVFESKHLLVPGEALRSNRIIPVLTDYQILQVILRAHCFGDVRRVGFTAETNDRELIPSLLFYEAEKPDAYRYAFSLPPGVGTPPQRVTNENIARYRQGLDAAGYLYYRDTVTLAMDTGTEERSRSLHVGRSEIGLSLFGSGAKE